MVDQVHQGATTLQHTQGTHCYQVKLGCVQDPSAYIVLDSAN